MGSSRRRRGVSRSNWKKVFKTALARFKRQCRRVYTRERAQTVATFQQFEKHAIVKQLRPYFLVLSIFLLVTIAAIDWLARLHQNEQNLNTSDANFGTSSTAQAVLKKEAWEFFHPTWQTKGKSFFEIEPSDFPMAQADLSDFLNDPEAKIEPEFRVPPSLKKRVLFWVEIYAKYSSRMKVVHDRNNPQIIYGHIDLRPLYRVLGYAAAETRALEIEKQVLFGLKQRLTDAISNRPSSLLAIDEQAHIREFLSAIGALSTKETAKIVESIRSQTGQRDVFLQALHRSASLLPHIESVFRSKGLPISLARIPFVESSFNERALSNAGAVGIWQFMPETAKQMIHPEEERHWSDPIKQTQSAAKLLKIYRSLLPDWGTTVTSYNSGVGRVRKLLDKYHVRRVEGLISVESSDGLGFAGQNFYTEVLAANIVEHYKENIFRKMLGPIDLTRVFNGSEKFPKELSEL